MQYHIHTLRLQQVFGPTYVCFLQKTILSFREQLHWIGNKCKLYWFGHAL